MRNTYINITLNLTALQRIEDVNYLHDGIQLMVETL